MIQGTIQSAQYTDSQNFCVLVVDSTDASIYVPADPANADYQLIEAWVAAGNTIAGAS